ncbi:MAG: PASTA domain-containing protein [Firmicutes bacterium]|nr:PASTA domain-containing protein [Bacillota bacterium]
MEEFEDGYEICPYCGYEIGTPSKEAYHMRPGTILAGRYLIGRVLGFGGFGVTYLGWDEILLRKVAIKEYLPGEFSTRIPGQTQITTYEGERSEQFDNGLGKFLEEAKMLAKLESANGVVRIYNSFQENNTAYIIMEYLEGRTLKEYLALNEKLPVEEAKEILHPIITALKEVHEMGIIHRDIAPDNIFLTNDGRVKLLDFGASRFATTSHSKSLSVIIKPGYAPVEQYRSRGDQGPWTDIYSLAATFYKMVTGITPEDAMERVEKEELKKPSKMGVEIPKNTEHAIMNALNIKIEDRTRNAEAFEKELYGNDKVKLRFVHLKKADVGKWPLWAKLATSGATLAVMIFAVLLATGVIDYSRLIPEGFALPEGMTRVPNLVNEDVDTAEVLMEEAELVLQIVDKQYSEYVPMGLVLSQNVNRGKIVKIENVVEVVVSGGREPVVIPDICGYQKDSVQETLSALGLVLEIQEEYGAFEAGVIMAQSPEAGGQAYRGDTIVLTVSLGLDTYLDAETEIIIPDFTGMSMKQATAKASEMGLYLVKAGEREDALAPGTILEQSPRAGVSGLQGDVIKIVTAAEEKLIYMPDMQYREIAEASAELEALGFVVQIGYEESSTVAKDKIIRQNVAANTQTKKGTEIMLTVSSGTAAVNQIIAQKPQWSEWVEELPAGVNSSGYEIETKTQYSFRDKSLTTSDKEELDGWTLYDTTTARGEYGPWSQWDSVEPTEQEGREISDKIQYSYSDYETMKSDKASVSGWKLIDTRTYYLEDYGSWSVWSDTPVDKSATREVQTKTQYSFRTRSKEYKNASTKSQAGYTYIENSRKENDGGWSDWTETPISSSETESYRIDVDTQQRTRSVYDHTEYWYYYWKYRNELDNNNYWYTWSQAYAAPRGGTYAETGWRTGMTYQFATYEGHAAYSDSPSAMSNPRGTIPWYLGGQRDIYRDETYTVYRSRTVSYTYSFWRWSDWSGWSDWSDNKAEKSDTVEVKTRIQYRYRDKIPHYEYTHERWKEYTAWSDTQYTESSTRKVKTQTVYKYRDRTDVITYHFYQWGAWSDWRDEKAEKSDSREVAQRTLYRYRPK